MMEDYQGKKARDVDVLILRQVISAVNLEKF